MRLTENFRLDEFHCKNGIPAPQRYHDRLKRLCENLEVLRAELDCPIVITSGYRTPAYNEAVGGAKNSQHVKGRAADIRAAAHVYTPEHIGAVIEKLIAEGRMEEGGLGVYKGWVHYDIRGKRARW